MIVKTTQSTDLSHKMPLNIGFWASFLSTIALLTFTICFSYLLTTQPIFTWTHLEDYVALTATSNQTLQDLARLMMLAFAPLFMVILSCIHEQVTPEQRVLSRIAATFGTMFATSVGIHYFIQLTAVRISLANNQLTGLEQLVQANPYSASASINMLGWTLFLGIASLFIAPCFRGSRLGKVIRASFLLNGSFCLLGGVGYIFDNVPLIFLSINFGMGGMLLIITIALTRWFAALRHLAPK